MYEIRLREIISRLEVLIPIYNIYIFFNQKTVLLKLVKDLNQQWDFTESKFFGGLSENDKYTRYTLFIWCVYTKFRQEPGLNLKGCWDKYYEKFCDSRYLELNDVSSWNLDSIFFQ